MAGADGGRLGRPDAGDLHELCLIADEDGADDAAHGRVREDGFGDFRGEGACVHVLAGVGDEREVLRHERGVVGGGGEAGAEVAEVVEDGGRVLGAGLLRERDEVDGGGPLAGEFLAVVVVERLEVAVGHGDGAVRDVGVAEGDVLSLRRLVAADVLSVHLGVGDADGGAEQGVELLGAALGAEVVLDGDEVRRRVGVVDDALELGAVDPALPIGEELGDDGVGVRPHEHVADLGVGDGDAEPVHLALAEAVLDEPVVDHVGVLVADGLRGGLAAALLVGPDFLLERLRVLLVRDRLAIHDGDVLPLLEPDVVEGSRILKHPESAEREDEDPEDHPRALAHLGHYAHTSLLVFCLLMRHAAPRGVPMACRSRSDGAKKPAPRGTGTNETEDSTIALRHKGIFL